MINAQGFGMSKINLVLLSGGSGKRLWPLSNGVRSKQFLKVLKAPNDKYESMVQRIVRQISEAGLDASITIATGISHVDSIASQLGTSVEVVAEPERRDTFPAIALASSYLFKSKNLSRDDVVVVMPIDPYTELGYFETIAKMAKAVENNEADLVLMGIKPTEPSTKFGYIVPTEKDGEILKVSRFTEKPTESLAKELIENGALWNGGVFAFKLGYIIDIVAKYVSLDSFASVREHYKDFPKISFDYEVAEKAKSIAVVPFSGQWKDLGTWDSLFDEIQEKTIGNVIVDDSATGTKAINELPIPVICLGIKDSVVVASADGIFIGNKESSVNLKSYAESVENRPMCEERRWGDYRVLSYDEYPDGMKSLTKILNFNNGGSVSYQTHNFRDEVWTVSTGTGRLVLDGVFSDIKRGDVINIKAGQKHAVKGIDNLQIIEVQLGSELSEFDIQRYDLSWE